MKRLFTERDIDRWIEANNRATAILERRLGDSPELSNDVQGLSMLALVHIDIAFENFATGDCKNGRRYLRSAVQWNLRILELYLSGYEPAKGYARTGEFQTVLVGFACGDDILARRYAEAYCTDSFSIERSPEDSNFIGLPIKALATGNREEARRLLSRERPSKVDTQFLGYIECLIAISEGDTANFRGTIKEAELYWHSFMKRRFQGFPQATCFLGGMGLQRLAEITLDVKFDFHFCCPDGSS